MSGDLPAVRTVLSSLPDATSTAGVVNHTGNGAGSNTLLFKASEHGHRDLVAYLLDCGADGRIHPVTKYSPLYIAAYNGHKDVVELLLGKLHLFIFFIIQPFLHVLYPTKRRYSSTL